MENSTTLTTTSSAELAPIHAVGQAADDAARRHAFDDYQSRKSDNTLNAHRIDLTTFCTFLAEVGVDLDAADLMGNPIAWSGITFGLVEGFVKWLLREGYAVASVNRKLSTVKRYCTLAAKAGVLDIETIGAIKMVQGYSTKDGKRIDERRETSRKSTKKAEHTSLTVEDANALKFNPQTPQGRRDTVLMCLLLDHGLRVGELADLMVTGIDMEAKQFTFYRLKVDMTQTHNMSRHTYDALREYFDHGDAPAMGPLLRSSRKGGKLTHAGMSRYGITGRVGTLGEEIGVEKLSAHDCRHYWASRAAAMGTDMAALRDAGGWSSLAMPSRYVEAATDSQ